MWEPTSRGGFRRTGVAQRQSAACTEQRSAHRKRPPVLRLNEKLGLPSCPYLIRWRFETPWGSVRLHHWLGPDDDRAFHDHPWWFWTFILHGGYTDRSLAGDDHLHAGMMRYRPALHQHTVIPDPQGAWTLLITGPPVRSWGFWLNGKFRKANKWFLTYGHHPCKLRRLHVPRENLPPLREEKQKMDLSFLRETAGLISFPSWQTRRTSMPSA